MSDIIRNFSTINTLYNQKRRFLLKIRISALLYNPWDHRRYQKA